MYNLQHDNYINHVVHCMPSTYLTYNWKFILLSSPYKHTRLSLTIFPKLYVLYVLYIFLMTHLFCNWRFVPLNLLHLFSYLPTSSPLATFVFCNSESIYVCSFFIFQTSHMREIIWCLSFSI